MIFSYDSYSEISQIYSVMRVNQNVARDFYEFLLILNFILMISYNFWWFGDLDTRRMILSLKIESQ